MADDLFIAETVSSALRRAGVGVMSESDRITRLETHFDYMRADLAELKSGQKEILSALQGLPTKIELKSWTLQWTVIGIAAMSLVVLGIIGGLDWIKTH